MREFRAEDAADVLGHGERAAQRAEDRLHDVVRDVVRRERAGHLVLVAGIQQAADHGYP